MSIVEKMARAIDPRAFEPFIEAGSQVLRHEDALHKARAAISATGLTEAQLEGLASGAMVVVPVEPTEAMYAAACDPSAIFKHTLPEERGGKIPLLPAMHWRAMLAAKER